MNKDNRNALLSDLYEFQYGTGNTIENIGGDYPIYGSNGAVGFTNVFNSEEAPVIGHIGAYAGIVNWASGKHYVTYNGVICKIREGINPRYGYYVLLNSKLQKRLRGSTQPFISYDLLNDVKVYLPEKPTQDSIASVLTALDSKIELNNRINAELEAMAKTLYDYWFVQFDFPDKNGKPYKTSGGKMVWNAELKREIPEGWEDGTLNSLGEIIGGSTPPKENEKYFSKNGTAWITPKDLSLNTGNKFITKGEYDVTKEGIKASSLNVMPKGTILLSSRAPIGYLAISREEVTTNQGFKSFVPNKGFSTEYVFSAVQRMIPTIENNGVGSTFKEVSASTLKTIPIPLPNKKLAYEYTNKVKEVFERQNILELENHKLTELRDWLLPMLMNGQVRVSDLNETELLMAAEPKMKYGK